MSDKVKNKKARNKIEDAEELSIDDLMHYRNAYFDITSSGAYRVGLLVTSPLRILKRTLRPVRRYAGRRRHLANLSRHINEVYSLNKVGVKSGKRQRVDIIIRNIHHPTSSAFIRLVSPFSENLLKKTAKIKLINGEHPKLTRKTDTIIVQRTAIPNIRVAKKIVDHAKKYDIRLYVDTDDAFSELDKKHPEHDQQVHRVEALDYIMEHADEVWFSTERLKDLYALKKSRVIRNTLDPKLWIRLRNKKINVPSKDEPLRLVYMGTATHDHDFEIIVSALNKLYENFPGKFEVHIIGVGRQLGTHPWMVLHVPEDTLYPDFVRWFGRLKQFDIGLSPLEDNAFNGNKSDIKCLDYLACGIHPMVSDVEAYRVGELDKLITRVENSQEAWYTAIEKQLKEKVDNRRKMKATARKGFEYIMAKRTSSEAARNLHEAMNREQHD